MRFREYPELRQKLIELVKNPTPAAQAIEQNTFDNLPFCTAVREEARTHPNEYHFLMQAFGKASTSIDQYLQNKPDMQHAANLLDVMHEANERVEQQGGQKPTNPYETAINLLERISMEGLPAEQLADVFIEVYQRVLDYQEMYGPDIRSMKQRVQPIIESIIYHCYEQAVQHEHERYDDTSHKAQKDLYVEANDRISRACFLALEDSRVHETPAEAPYQPADRAMIIGENLVFEYKNAQGNIERRYYPAKAVKQLFSKETIGPLHIDEITH